MPGGREQTCRSPTWPAASCPRNLFTGSKLPGGATLSKLNMSKLTEKVDLRVGMGLKFAETDTVKFRFESTCGNGNCSDNQHMFTIDVDLDKLVNKFTK